MSRCFGGVEMEFQIRQGQIMDAKDIYALNVKEMGYDYPIEKTEEKARGLLESGKDKIFVAVAGGAVIGYVHACGYDAVYAPHLKNIMGIAVSSSFRKKGAGRALLKAVEDWAQKDGAAGVRLASGAERTGAHAFYRRCGYTGGKRQIRFQKMFEPPVR